MPPWPDPQGPKLLPDVSSQIQKRTTTQGQKIAYHKAFIFVKFILPFQ